MSSTNTLDPEKAINDRVQRIADFVRGQENLTHVFKVWDVDRQIIAQALPDADAALGMLRQLVQRRHASNASDAGRGHACPISGRLTRLDKQVRTCVRALKNAGVEFILAWRITGETPHLDLHTAPPRPHVVRDVIADLERTLRLERDRARVEAGELIPTAP